MAKNSQSKHDFRPPVITILGHVDHGKTTLLDTIRKTNIAAREHGGITQHIGAYQIQVSPQDELSSRASNASRGIPSEHKKEILRQAQDDFVPSGHKITFIDTPGHEAFSKMRGRGADVADIVILVVAANDGVMPQTIESIELIKTAKLPAIVAVNKIDLPDVNIEKIKKQLVKHGLNLEEYGGDIPVVPLSAKSGQGVDKLLKMILLLAELNQVQSAAADKFKAVVIESTLSKNKGAVATIIVRSSNLTIGDEVVCEDQEFKIRALIDWLGKNHNMIVAGDPAEILGWKEVPIVGAALYKKGEVTLSQMEKKEIISFEKAEISSPPSTEQELKQEKIKLIIKSDNSGTLEAIFSSLPQNAVIISMGVGNITESDILLAKTAKALVIGFNLKVSDSVLKLAESEKVILKTYNIIYELLDEIDDVVEAALKGNLVEILGQAKIMAVFPMKDQTIAGVKVISGRIARGDQVKIVRKDAELGRTRIKSLRHGKEDITKAEQGAEAGIILAENIAFLTGDSIISIG